MTDPRGMSEEDWANAREVLRQEKLAARRRLFAETLEASKRERVAVSKREQEEAKK